MRGLAADPSRIPALAGREPRAPRPGDEQLKEVLGVCCMRLGAEGIHPFLAFGSLLGAVREKGFIPGDGDIDMGVNGLGDFERARSILDARPLTVAGRRLPGIGSKMVVRHPNGAKIDLKPFVWNGRATQWMTRYSGFLLERSFERRITPVPVDLRGVQTWIPDCHDAMLTFQYGDWRTPDRLYHYVTSGPVRGDAHREWTRAAGPYAILRVIEGGNLPKAAAMARSMGGYFPDPVWEALATAIETADSALTGRRAGGSGG
jgi:hypothetical protein